MIRDAKLRDATSYVTHDQTQRLVRKRDTTSSLHVLWLCSISCETHEAQIGQTRCTAVASVHATFDAMIRLQPQRVNDLQRITVREIVCWTEIHSGTRNPGQVRLFIFVPKHFWR